MSITVPYRHKSEIEQMSFDLLRRYEAWTGKKLAPPINIDGIIEGYLKLDLQFVDLKELLSIPDVLGATWFDDNVIRIESSLEQKEGRLSFTMAHEVGHWWMHRPIYEMNKVSLGLPMFSYEEHKKPTPAVVCRTGKKKDPAEWQADQFAAMLLMPKSMMRVAVASIQAQGPLPIEDFEKFDANAAENQNLRAAARQLINTGFSNVSVDAMCYRLIDLKLVTDSKPKQGLLY